VVSCDAVASRMFFGALAGGGENTIPARRMRIFLEEMMFHHPGVVVAAPSAVSSWVSAFW